MVILPNIYHPFSNYVIKYTFIITSKLNFTIELLDSSLIVFTKITGDYHIGVEKINIRFYVCRGCSAYIIFTGLSPVPIRLQALGAMPAGSV